MVSGAVLASGLGGPSEVVLLSFVELAIDTLHASGWDSCLGEDDMESRSHCLDKRTYVGCHWVGASVEQVGVLEDGPSIQFLDSGLRSGWESHVRGCESLSIGKRQRSAGLGYLSLLDHELDGLRLSMAFTHTSKGGKAFSKGHAGTGRLEGAEDLVGHLGGRKWEAAGSQGLIRGVSPFFGIAT
jgi:hypothetical protein